MIFCTGAHTPTFAFWPHQLCAMIILHTGLHSMFRLFGTGIHTDVLHTHTHTHMNSHMGRRVRRRMRGTLGGNCNETTSSVLSLCFFFFSLSLFRVASHDRFFYSRTRQWVNTDDPAPPMFCTSATLTPSTWFSCALCVNCKNVSAA